MAKVIITTADILYICVPTAQNTINIYPITQIKKGLNGIIFIHLITTKGADINKWNERLKKVFKSYRITELIVEEHLSYTELLSAIKNDLTELYTFGRDTQVVINYGGGLKILTPVLFALCDELPNSNFTMTYPEKQENHLVWDKIVSGKIHCDKPKALEIGISSSELMSMYGDYEYKSFHTIDTEACHTVHLNLINIIEKLENIYVFEDLKNLLYDTITDVGDKDIEALETDIAETFISFFAKQKDVRRKIVQKNVTSAFNNKKCEWSINGNYNLKHETEYKSKLPFQQIPDTLTTIFLNHRTYKEVKSEYILQKVTKDFLSTSTTLSLPDKIQENEEGTFSIPHSSQIISNIFKSYKGLVPKHDKYSDIGGHGTYFELYCLKHITEWAKQNKKIIREVIYSFQPTEKSESGKGKKVYETDIMVYTHEGTIIFFECKTYKFASKEFLAAYFQANEYGGVFNKYIIVLPPLPSPSSAKFENISRVFNDYKNLLGKSRNVTCCQIDATGDTKDIIFPSLDSELARIIKSESR